MKKFIILFGSFLILQLASYYSFAEPLLPEAITEDRHSLVVEEPNKVHFSSSEKLSTVQVNRISSKLKRTFSEVVHGEDNRINKSVNLVCFYSFAWEMPIPFYAVVSYSNLYKEERGGDAYVESFELKYIWLLFSWLEIEHNNTGQS
jgi:hypothetical protein